MLDWLPAQVIERLPAALRAGLIVETRPGQFRFSHILVRDAFEDDLGPAAEPSSMRGPPRRGAAAVRGGGVVGAGGA